MERPRSGSSPVAKDSDRLFDQMALVGRRGLRYRAVERGEVGIQIDLGQSDVGPVVTGW